MQLLIPTARVVARKYNSSTQDIDASTLFQPALNIELGTAYIRDQLTNSGASNSSPSPHNAGPGRVPQWQATLPARNDEFVEVIPFKETKGYVQGIIRNPPNTADYTTTAATSNQTSVQNLYAAKLPQNPRDQFAQEFPEIVLDEKSKGE